MQQEYLQTGTQPMRAMSTIWWDNRLHYISLPSIS